MARTIPADNLQELREALAAAGLTLGPLADGSRYAHTVEHDGRTYRVTFMGTRYGWCVFGPGMEHGVGALAEDVPELINRPAGPQLPDGPLEWAVRHRDGRQWPSEDQAAAEAVATASRTMTAVYRTPGGDWTPWDAGEARAAEAGAPRTYAGHPVPEVIRQAWNADLGDGWRLGIRTALAR